MGVRLSDVKLRRGVGGDLVAAIAFGAIEARIGAFDQALRRIAPAAAAMPIDTVT